MKNVERVRWERWEGWERCEGSCLMSRFEQEYHKKILEGRKPERWRSAPKVRKEERLWKPKKFFSTSLFVNLFLVSPFLFGPLFIVLYLLLEPLYKFHCLKNYHTARFHFSFLFFISHFFLLEPHILSEKELDKRKIIAKVQLC